MKEFFEEIGIHKGMSRKEKIEMIEGIFEGLCFVGILVCVVWAILLIAG